MNAPCAAAPRRLVAAALGLLLVAATACSSSSDAGSDSGSSSSDSLELTVLAASSLTEAFGELAKTYQSDHSDVQVELTFDSSSTLAEQVVAGAPADVLATADEATMQGVVDEGLTAAAPEVFARNRLTLVTPADNPADVASIDDIERGDVTYAVCVRDAPCGAASRTLLDLVGVRAEPVTEEDNVRDVLTKVTTGEVDAGLVYVSDAQAAGSDVTVIDVPESDQALNADVIAALTDAAEPDAAASWLELVLSKEGQQVLGSYGFLPAG
ncbi:MAG: molybdate ABC transporter substrate-binding protein [Actinomycetota bacterium]|nr:molybdate ABC transporter substrate-binding protein [Actinomycetota bacterium]